MIGIERPAGLVVREAGALLGIMTLDAGIGLVTVIANGVHLFLGLFDPGDLLDVVAVAATFFFVAVDATEPEQVDVFFVLERDDRRRLIRCFVDFLDRLGDNRMRLANDVGRVVWR